MTVIQIMKEIIKKEVPNYPRLPDQEKEKVVRKIIYDNIEPIIQKIKLPRPPTRFQIILEQLRDKRRSQSSLKRRKPINYHLWSLLYAIKSNVGKSVASSFATKFGFSDDSTTSILQVNLDNNNTTAITKHEQILDTDIDYNSRFIPYFQIEEKLEKKIMYNDTFGQFVSCLDEVCLKKSKIDPNLEFELKEMTDPEIPEWNKLILNVKFYDDDVRKKIERFKELRSHINDSINLIKTNVDKDELNSLIERFHIKLVS